MVHTLLLAPREMVRPARTEVSEADGVEDRLGVLGRPTRGALTAS